MSKTKKATEQDLSIKETSIEVGYISFRFPVTRDEADAIVNNKKSVVAKKLKHYVNSLLKAGCKKFLETSPNENVSECNIIKSKDL